MVDEIAGLRGGGAHNAPDHVRGQLFDDIDRVVDIELLHDPGKLGIGDGIDDALLLGRFKVCKDVRCGLLRQKAEDHGHAVVVDLGEEFRHVKFVEFLHAALQFFHVMAVQQLRQLIGLLFNKGLVIQALVLFKQFLFLQQVHLPGVCSRKQTYNFIMLPARLQLFLMSSLSPVFFSRKINKTTAPNARLRRVT